MRVRTPPRSASAERRRPDSPDTALHVPDRPPRYLVTGGRGFIGAHTVRRLVLSGCEVHATTRKPPPVSAAEVTWWQADLADGAATRHIVDQVRPDAVIHLASRAEGPRDLDLVVPMLNDNVLSVINIMAAAMRIPGCRVVVPVRSRSTAIRAPARVFGPPTPRPRWRRRPTPPSFATSATSRSSSYGWRWSTARGIRTAGG